MRLTWTSAGLHSHIGSQIFGTEAFAEAARIVIDFAALLKVELGLDVPAIDLGGGVASPTRARIRSRPPRSRSPVPWRPWCASAAPTTALPIPHVSVEPGRSIAGPSMVMLYRVGVVKDISLEDGGVRRYVAIDGGMSDNIRPVLYDAAYTATLANRDPAAGLVSGALPHRRQALRERRHHHPRHRPAGRHHGR